jgi:hypothetical protein
MVKAPFKKKFKYDTESDIELEDEFLDLPRYNWEIHMTFDKAINMDSVVNFLKAHNRWAYVYTKQHTSLRYYSLNAYIVLPFPQTEDWWRYHLGNHGEITMTCEPPNDYRNLHMGYMSHLDREYSLLIKIDKGPYSPHIATFTPRVGGAYILNTGGKMYNLTKKR